MFNSKKKKNLIAGCGFSGAVLAERLANILNEDVLIIDKNSAPGGLSFDYKDKNNINIHKFGSHIFHTNYEYIWKYLSKFASFIPYLHKENVIIDGNKANIPFNLNSIYDIFPKKLASKFENKLIKKYGYGEKVSIFDIKTKPFFWDRDLDFLASYFYKKLFSCYADKKWGNAGYDLSNAYIQTDKDNRVFKDKYQGIPETGYTKLIENILNHKNIKVLFDIDFKNIDANGFDRIFYTGSIDEFFNYKFGILQYKSAKFEISEINKEFYQNTGIVKYPYNHDFLKIHEFKHYSNIKCDKTVIAKEYIEDFKPNTGTDRFYPVLNGKNLEIFNRYKIETKKFKDVYFLGRLGDFKNYSIDKAIKRALEVFETIRFKSILDENLTSEAEQLITK